MRQVPVCILLALSLAGCAGLSPGPTAQVTGASTNEAVAAAALISQYRAAYGLPPVTVDGKLNRAAEVQARAVAEAGSLSHGAFASRMASFGIRGTAAENLTAGSHSVDEAVARLRASPAHNANLLMPEARHVGLARADSPSRYGRYWALVLSQ